MHRDAIYPPMFYNFDRIDRSGYHRYKDLQTPYDPRSVMHYSSYGFQINGQLTMTQVVNGKDTGRPVPYQRDGISPMDIYEICKMYNCKRCADQIIGSYSGQAYKNEMLKCSGVNDSYYWKSNCNDGVKDCPNGDDESTSNANCAGFFFLLYYFSFLYIFF